MNPIDATPYLKGERVLNFNFSTHMILRCIERKYAKTFINGEIRFSQPKTWIKEEEKGNKGKGDKLEGIFLATTKNDKSEFIKHLKENSNVNYFSDNEFTYFRNKNIEELYCLCFYGLNDNSFVEKTIDKKGKVHYNSHITKEYFESFSEKITKEEYMRKQIDDRPAVIFISNPHKFFERIIKFFMKFGIKENEIIISPVDYINKKKNMISGLAYPKELLLKDKYFQNQSEVRIIIASRNKELIDYMEKNNNKINIGKIDDIAEIYDYYFEDLIIEKINKNTIGFNLPFEVIEKYEDMSLVRMLTIIIQAYTDQLPDSLINEKERIIEKMQNEIKKKFNLEINYSNGNVNILNANDKIFRELVEYCEPHTKLTKFENEINLLIENMEFERALEKLNESIMDSNLKGVCEFYKGLILEKNYKYKEAIAHYDYCIENEIKLPDALSYRSTCYSRLGEYNLAIRDLQLLQDVIGYNPQIYTNKGINLIYLDKLKDAIKEFNKSIEMSEVNPEAYYNRSVAYFRLKEFNNAKEDIIKAMKYNPSNTYYKAEYEKFYV